MKKAPTCILILLICLACKEKPDPKGYDDAAASGTDSVAALFAGQSSQLPITKDINSPVSEVSGRELVEFARTLVGVPYKYASVNPLEGFDCSGFITYVFNHFNIKVPRSSVDFTNAGKEVDMQTAREGDLVLFTGTVDTIRVVGHMGIVTENSDTLKFIHSTSGKANGVTESVFSDHYKLRFIKVIRVLAR